MTTLQPCIDVRNVAKRYRMGTGIMSLADLFRLRKPSMSTTGPSKALVSAIAR
jgi:hypothetical protein